MVNARTPTLVLDITNGGCFLYDKDIKIEPK